MAWIGIWLETQPYSDIVHYFGGAWVIVLSFTVLMAALSVSSLGASAMETYMVVLPHNETLW